MRTLISIGIVAAVAVLIATWLARESRAQAPEKATLAGVWIRNHDLSDAPPSRGENGGRGRDGMGRSGRGGRGYGGGFGGGHGRANGGQQPPVDPDAVARMREALHDILQPPDQLTITQSDSMVLITGPDGRTTRLAPDGHKIKDENTKIERKTRWDAGNLISEINGAQQQGGKITQTFSVDREAHRLKIVSVVEAGHGQPPRTITNVYDADQPR